MADTIEEEARRLLAEFERSRWTEPRHPSTLGLILDAIRAGMRREREAVLDFASEDQRALDPVELVNAIEDGLHHPGGDPLKGGSDG